MTVGGMVPERLLMMMMMMICRGGTSAHVAIKVARDQRSDAGLQTCYGYDQ